MFEKKPLVPHHGFFALQFADFFSSRLTGCVLFWSVFFLRFFPFECLSPSIMTVMHWLLQKSLLASFCMQVCSIFQPWPLTRRASTRHVLERSWTCFSTKTPTRRSSLGARKPSFSWLPQRFLSKAFSSDALAKLWRRTMSWKLSFVVFPLLVFSGRALLERLKLSTVQCVRPPLVFAPTQLLLPSVAVSLWLAFILAFSSFFILSHQNKTPPFHIFYSASIRTASILNLSRHVCKV